MQGVAKTVRRPTRSTPPIAVLVGYALFVTEQPGLELALDSRAIGREGAHYGVVVETPEHVDATFARLQGAGYAVDVETEETCCYAVQNKVWATDPDGRRWETDYVLEESAERNYKAATCCTTDNGLTTTSSSCRFLKR